MILIHYWYILSANDSPAKKKIKTEPSDATAETPEGKKKKKKQSLDPAAVQLKTEPEADANESLTKKKKKKKHQGEEDMETEPAVAEEGGVGESGKKKKKKKKLEGEEEIEAEEEGGVGESAKKKKKKKKQDDEWRGVLVKSSCFLLYAMLYRIRPVVCSVESRAQLMSFLWPVKLLKLRYEKNTYPYLHRIFGNVNWK